MKKAYIKVLLNFAIFSLLYLFSCTDPVTPESDTGSPGRRSSCPELQSTSADNQLIVHFSDQLKAADIKIILDRYRTLGLKVYTCDCSNIQIALIEFPPGLTPEDRRRVAEDGLENEGNGQLFDNINLALPVFSGSYTETTFQNKPDPKNQIIVAVIDGGINKSNPTFLNHLWQNPIPASDRCARSDNGFDYTLKYQADTSRSNVLHPHGTLVSSILLNPLPSNVNINLMDLRIFDKNGKGSLFDALCAIQFAIDNGANIINMSWGYYNNNVHPLLSQYIQKLNIRKITVVASAGNENINTDSCLHHPSYFSSVFDNMIAVAALDPSESRLASYSNFGISTVAIAAPGTHSIRVGATTTNVDGTSYASPEVVKAAAILLTWRPDRTYLDIINCIYSSSTPLGLPVRTGGRLHEPLLDCPVAR